MTECKPNSFTFQPLSSREVQAAFDGGKITSDAGGLLLREIEHRFGFLSSFADCFTDHRDPDRIEFSVLDLLQQRVYGLCLGYEDLLDHDRLRHDPLLALMVGKEDPLGNDRMRCSDRGIPLAGKSTLNRLELTPVGADAESRYQKIVARLDQIAAFLVETFIRQQPTVPPRIVLDLDATDDPLHGHQLGRFFNGYYDEYCYLPLYIFAGDHPLAAILRPSDIDASAGCLVHLQRIIEQIRTQWPSVPIVLRGDSGFCRDYLMTWCEANGVDYLFGMAKNKRLLRILGASMQAAKILHQQSGEASRVFHDFEYQTRQSWHRARRVVGKAEHGDQGANPRFVVTSLSPEAFDARTLYEQEYCARGEMENRIKEQQLYLFADCLCCETMRANQLRLYLSTIAYVLMRSFREFALAGTEMSQAQCSTIREKLFKIGAVVRVSVRRVVLSMSQAYPWVELFTQVWENLKRLLGSVRSVVSSG